MRAQQNLFQPQFSKDKKQELFPATVCVWEKQGCSISGLRSPPADISQVYKSWGLSNFHRWPLDFWEGGEVSSSNQEDSSIYAPWGLPLKAVGHIAANYRDFFKLSLSPQHPPSPSALGQAAVANGCWQLGHLFNLSVKASRWDWLYLFAPVFLSFFFSVTRQWKQRKPEYRVVCVL